MDHFREALCLIEEKSLKLLHFLNICVHKVWSFELEKMTLKKQWSFRFNVLSLQVIQTHLLIASGS